ncbi:hypothetical protein C5Y93_09745 [Blastopirellula marina]|uniref:Uncharacterized protein n=1 Tax=Blastopirellula marina TaxID=124 RepID=A0A2S8GPA6_9BACT|nr:hypothetical protein C5Y93_09745 [Blastopirellula marina]
MLRKRVGTPCACNGSYFIPLERTKPTEIRWGEFGKLGVFLPLLRKFNRVPTDNEDWYDRIWLPILVHIPYYLID